MTAIVVIPPPEVWEPIQAIRSRYDSKIRRWMPHLTLVYPCRPATAFDEIEEPLRRACGGIAPFTLTFDHFRHFRHRRGSFTLWLAPEPAKPLIDLQAVLTAVLPDCTDQAAHRGGFTPHLSVGQYRGKAEGLRELVVELQAKWRPVSFTVREVCLIQRGPPPDDVFRVDRRVPLSRISDEAMTEDP